MRNTNMRLSRRHLEGAECLATRAGMSAMARTWPIERGRACPLRPGSLDINLFRYCECSRGATHAGVGRIIPPPPTQPLVGGVQHVVGRELREDRHTKLMMPGIGDD